MISICHGRLLKSRRVARIIFRICNSLGRLGEEADQIFSTHGRSCAMMLVTDVL